MQCPRRDGLSSYVGDTFTRITVALIALAVTSLAGCAASPPAAPTCAAEMRALAPITDKGARAAGGVSLSVDAANAAFAPTCITGVPRGIVTLTVHNTGAVLHNVEIAAQHIDVDVSPRHSVSIRVRVGAEPVVYVCRYHRALGMVGVLIPAPSG